MSSYFTSSLENEANTLLVYYEQQLCINMIYNVRSNIQGSANMKDNCMIVIEMEKCVLQNIR